MPSVEEESYWEPTIREFEQTDLVQGSPVAVAGQNYAIAGGTAQLPTYLKAVVVKEAGGAGATLTAGVDYTINLRTGVLTALGGGALAGDAAVWVSCTRTGNDDVPHRQLANRLKKLKDDYDALVVSVAGVADDLASLGVDVAADIAALSAATTAALANKADVARTIIAGAGLTGGGTLAADRTLNVVAANGTITVNADSIQVGAIGDTEHGNRGGGALHAAATNAANGFASAAHIQALEGVTGCPGIQTVASGNQANWDPGGWQSAVFVVCNNTSTLTFQGLMAPTTNGRRIKFFVYGGSAVVNFSHNNAAADANNKIYVNASHASLNAANQVLVVAYNDQLQRWYVVASID